MTDPRFSSLVTTLTAEPDVTVRPSWGAGNLVLERAGKIVAILMTTGFVAKLPRARVDELVAAQQGTRFDPRKNGRVMKEWLVAAPSCDYLALAREALAFARANAAASRPSAATAPRPRAKRSQKAAVRAKPATSSKASARAKRSTKAKASRQRRA